MDSVGWGQAFIVIINATYSDVKTFGEFMKNRYSELEEKNHIRKHKMIKFWSNNQGWPMRREFEGNLNNIYCEAQCSFHFEWFSVVFWYDRLSKITCSLLIAQLMKPSGSIVCNRKELAFHLCPFLSSWYFLVLNMRQFLWGNIDIAYMSKLLLFQCHTFVFELKCLLKDVKLCLAIALWWRCWNIPGEVMWCSA